MATLTPEQVYAQARSAGFSASQAVIMTAIAMGESGLRPDALGDTTIQTGTWGPSVGLWQVRTLKPGALAGARGADRYRDPARLTDPAYNAAAAYAISGKGKTFQPWSVYTSGAYKKNLTRAQQAAAAVGQAVTSVLAPVRGAAVSTPFGKEGPMWSSGRHTGQDYAVPVGTKVYATAPGTVVAEGASGGVYGNWVKLKLAGGYEAIYAHLSGDNVKKGDTVTAGQQIGLSGATGNVTGPHLHYEVRQNGTPVNPTTAATFAQVGIWDDWIPGSGLDFLNRLPGVGDAIPDGPADVIKEGAGAIKNALFDAGEVRDFVTTGTFLVLGVGLVVIGASKLAQPAREKALGAAGAVAGAAASKTPAGAAAGAAGAAKPRPKAPPPKPRPRPDPNDTPPF